MKVQTLSLLLTAWLLFFTTASQAIDIDNLDPVGKRYVEMLSNGGATTIRDTARSMHHSGESNPQVLDVAAEVLLRDYKNSHDATVIDAMAWVSNALGNAETNRYQPVLEEVRKNAGHRKLARYAQRNINNRLPDDTAYTQGLVDLEKVARATSGNSQAPTVQARARDDDYHPITVVREGMSMQEAYDLAGPPTATHQHQTGKAFNPFNVVGTDVVRQVALYRGQGRIVFSNVSTYSSAWRVVEVIENKDESGYP